MLIRPLCLSLASLALALTACSAHDSSPARTSADPAATHAGAAHDATKNTAPGSTTDALLAGGPVRAVAQLAPSSDSKVTGTVTFTQQPGGVEVQVRLENLPPGQHGFHIHEMGDCSAHDGMSAGGHFNPDNTRHGDRLSTERHAGDLGNLLADGAGLVGVTFTDTVLALSGPRSIIGRSIMVHADPDDGTTQPTGNSGARIACGVIEAATP